MRKFTRIFVIFLLSGPLSLHAQNLSWAIESGSEKEEYCLNHVVDRKSNIIISGKTTGDYDGRNSGKNDGFIVKLDATGKILWKRQFGSEGDEDILWSAVDKSGSVYVTGSTTGNFAGKNAGKEDVFIVKYDNAGKAEWKKQIGTDSSDVSRGICTDNKGFIYLTGATSGNLGGKQEGKTDCFVIKMDKNGNILAKTQFGTTADDNGYSIAARESGDIFVCGTTWGVLKGSNSGFIDGFTGHFTGSLDLVGYSQFGSEGFDIPLVLQISGDALYIGGSTSGNLAGDQAGDGDCFLLKMDEKGAVMWKTQFGTDHHDGVRGIAVDPRAHGRIFVSGIMNLPPEKAFIRIYENDGSLSWEKTFEGTSGKDINLDGQGNFTQLGLTGKDIFGKLVGGHDFYLIKYSLE